MKIVRTSEIPFADGMTRGKYKNRRKELGGEKLKAGLWELPAGHKSFPLHAHMVTEEALFVVSGQAKVRTLEGETPIGPGDYVSFEPGGPAHQLVNDGPEPLIYLALSTNHAGADMVQYPESNKTSVSIGAWPNAKRVIFPADVKLDYFEGDKDA